jgi:hypothetical protein
MSRLLSELLAAEEPLFSMAIKQLESAAGNTSVDVRLTAEIVGKVHMKVRSLGLDPRDTTGPELYRALFNLTAQHDLFIARRIGIDDPYDVQAVLSRIAETAAALDVPKTAWVLKTSVAKRLLRQTPPKNVMKQLGYRSVDSMIKRESIGELFSAMRFLENKSWLDKFILKYKDLRPSDFETKHIQVIHMHTEKWGKSALGYVQESRHNVTHLKELGIVAILPLPILRMRGLSIITLPLVLHYINEIRVYTSFFKSQQVRANFGKILVETLVDDNGHHAQVAGQHIHWRVIHRHFGGDSKAAEIFEPHIEPDDLIWRKTEETLFRLEPALHFWYDVEYVGVLFDNKAVSFNLMDMAVSYANNMSYGEHSVHHLRESIWNEIYLRYVKEQAIEKNVLSQLQQNTELNIIALGLKGSL